MTPSKWAVPSVTRGEVDRAGRLLARNGGLADVLQIGHALDVVNNWRAAHSFPLNTFQVVLRDRVKRMGALDAVVAQRLKRTPSIIGKLRRYSSMRLSRMQDIGGVRAVLSDLTEVEDLWRRYRAQEKRAKHAFVTEKNYIREPKASGYRGIHLVYRYRSARHPTYDGLHIEIQLRTDLQHAWATAVETVGTFLGQSLKSSEGPGNWLRFFELAGSVFAQEEGSPTGPNVPGDAGRLAADTRKAMRTLRVEKRLLAFGIALSATSEPDVPPNGYVLLALEPERSTLTLRSYASGQLAASMRDYLEQEKHLAAEGGDVVLVAADSLASLRRAYPNYFGDTRTFVEELKRLLG